MDPGLREELAGIYVRYGAFEGAAELLSGIMESFPSAKNLPHVVLATAAVLKQLGLVKESASYLTFLTGTDPKVLARLGFTAAEMQLQLGMVLESLHKPAEADRCFREAYRLHARGLEDAAAKSGADGGKGAKKGSGSVSKWDEAAFAAWVELPDTWKDLAAKLMQMRQQGHCPLDTLACDAFSHALERQARYTTFFHIYVQHIICNRSFPRIPRIC